jgi:hypothetical protein
MQRPYDLAINLLVIGYRWQLNIGARDVRAMRLVPRGYRLT